VCFANAATNSTHASVQVETVIENARGERDAERDDAEDEQAQQEDIKREKQEEKSPERQHKVKFEEAKVGEKNN